MPGTLAELYAGILRQRNEPQGVLSQPATSNPLMMAKALRQEQSYPRTPLSEAINAPMTWQQFFDNVQAHFPIDSPAAVRQGAFNLGMSVGPQMTVWQGSPHRFAPTKNNPLGEFDSTKIGSGEGAQAYGYGHYLAENPATATEYRRALAGPELDATETARQIAFAKAKAAQATDPAVKRGYLNAAEELTQNGGKPGHLYKVDLPDDQIAKMLDWDKPLSQQPEAVKQLAAQFNGGKLPRESMSGDELLRWMQQTMRYTGQSGRPEDLLHAAGVPGIRYLDQGSRGAGSGTSNFVVFPGNEGVLKILARE
jgi:hypothetical protein